MNARFMDVELLVERGVLVPRAETELLGATALELAPENARQVAAAVAELRREALEKKPAEAPPPERLIVEMVSRFSAVVGEPKSSPGPRV